jgi:hypothetical protein
MEKKQFSFAYKHDFKKNTKKIRICWSALEKRTLLVTQGVTAGDTIWYKCKCKKNMSLKLLYNQGRCVVCLESDFFTGSHKVNEEIDQNGLPDGVEKI